jgi:hypothetical protein
MWKKSTFSGGAGMCVEVFRKSSFSQVNGSCVDVARGDAEAVTKVRHSQRPDAEVIEYTEPEWQAFISGVKAGEFD